jgi:WD40 repeat protein
MPIEVKPVLQSIRRLAQAESQGAAEAAIQDIVGQSFSLGLLDEQGTQLNPYIGPEAVSLTPDDVAAYAIASAGGYYRTIDYVVEFLAHVGLSLDAAGQPITTTDLLPDLQVYVDWSFAHPDDPKSALGLLLAAGPELEVPDSPPQMEGNTRISPLAGLLLLADLLIGVEQQFIPADLLLDDGTTSAIKKAAPVQQDQDDLIVRVKGLVRVLHYTLNSGTVKLLAMTLPEKMQEQISNIRKNLGVIRALIAIYEAADHFAVRTVHMDGTRANYLELKKTGSFYPLESKLVAIIPGSGEQEVKGVPLTYHVQLFSPYEAISGGPLFEDADAVLVPAKANDPNYKSGLNGHRLRATTNVAEYDIEAKNMRNEEKKTALLFASVRVPLDRFGRVLQEYKETIEWLTIGVTVEELQKMVNILARDIKPMPTMSIVTFKAQEEVEPTATAKSEPIPRPKLINTLSGHSGEVSSAKFSPDGTRLVSVAPREVFLWDANTGERLSVLQGAQDTQEVVWSPDGQMLAGTGGSQAKVWQADTGQVDYSLEVGSPSGALDWSPDASRLAIGTVDGSTTILDAETGELLSTLAGHSDSVRVVRWSPDGARLVTAAGDVEASDAAATAIVWDAATGESLYTFDGYEDAVWSPDGSQLALWSMDITEELGTSIVVDAATGEVAVSDDGIEQTTQTGGIQRYWRVRWQEGLSIAFVPKWDETQVHVLGPRWVSYLDHEAQVIDLNGSADGSMIACGLADGTVVYWTLEETNFLFQ